MNTCKQWIAASLCLLLSPLPAFCQSAANDHAGQIKALIPAATRNAKPAKVKDDLEWNDLLQTQKAGRLRAGLKDGSILSLGSNSELRVVQHDAASQQTSLEMDFGKVRSKVVKITQPNGKFEMKTPNAVIGVIGTDFYVGYEANRTTVICYTGQVSVTPLGDAKVMHNSGQASGNSIAVSAGQMVVISTEIPRGRISIELHASRCFAGEHGRDRRAGYAAAGCASSPGAEPDHWHWGGRDRMGCRIYAVEPKRRSSRAAAEGS